MFAGYLPLAPHEISHHKSLAKGACNRARGLVADNVRDERFPAHLSTRPKLLHTLAVRKG